MQFTVSWTAARMCRAGGKAFCEKRWRECFPSSVFTVVILYQYQVFYRLGIVSVFQRPAKSHLFHHFKYWIILLVEEPSARSNHFRSSVPKQRPPARCWQRWHLGAHPCHWTCPCGFGFLSPQSNESPGYLWWRANYKTQISKWRWSWFSIAIVSLNFKSPDNQEYATILNKNLTFIFWKLSTTMNHEKLSEHVFPEL